MVRRGRKTISESFFSDKYEFVELAKNWRPDAITVILNLIWQGYDLYQGDVLSKIDLSQADDQLERDITQTLSVYIEQAKSGFEPFVIRSEWFEMETREPSPARPKQYDLAFVWSNPPNVRIVWPIEAKVLRSDGSVTEYVNEITGNYLTCGYAPFSSEAGMLGYLLKGSSTTAFKNIGTAVPCTLSAHSDFLGRQHKVSDHTRTVPTSERYPVKFRCHHLLLELAQKSDVQKATAKRKSSKKTPES
ncbi:hypothetical protein [Coleofasciculus sp. FACHB-501]|uniref:hypothetical protein n=1 Tax=Cyanophyceae TaxID=3028117 RepID=UPI00168666F8|nr:hypothetical protein [Coleofasciculus sp. FACHB-501]MBD1840905.1 hypothetical protein [Coleofasciculus sp. FACHB-501]